MWRFIFKVRFLLEKVMQRTNVEGELYYIETRFRHYLDKDDQPMRVEMAKLKAIKEPTPDTKKQIMELDVEIQEVQAYRSMVYKSKTKIDELTKLIDASKEFLWK